MIKRTSPAKGKRRSKQEIRELCDLMLDIGEELQPMTVRQLFYQLVSRGAIPKTEAAYKGTVCRLLAKLRKTGEMPFSWLADNTRWQRKPRTYSGLDSMLWQQQRFYRRAIWDDQGAYVEVWLEKEALAGVLLDVTAEWDVPLMVTRGYPSLSYVHETAMQIAEIEKPVFLYYFGDHDPSGVDIPRVVEEGIREYAPNADLYFQRVAVLPEQIQSLGLPTRPTKKTDSRSKSFTGESVEVDAIQPSMLREICRDCIMQHIDPDILERTRAVESAERQTLSSIAGGLLDE